MMGLLALSKMDANSDIVVNDQEGLIHKGGPGCWAVTQGYRGGGSRWRLKKIYYFWL